MKWFTVKTPQIRRHFHFRPRPYPQTLWSRISDTFIFDTKDLRNLVKLKMLVVYLFTTRCEWPIFDSQLTKKFVCVAGQMSSHLIIIISKTPSQSGKKKSVMTSKSPSRIGNWSVITFGNTEFKITLEKRQI